MNNISFKEFEDSDLPHVLNIYNYYVSNSTATFQIKLLTIDEMKELVVFNNPKYKAFCIFQDDILCGYTMISQFKKREAFDRTAEIGVYIHKDYIGNGIGHKAIKYIEKYTNTTDIKVLIATITGDNYNSIKLFEKNGYTKSALFYQVGYKFNKLLDVVCYQKML